MKVNFNSTVKQISDFCNCEILTRDSKRVIDTISSDSRDLGDNNLFIPLIGEQFDGHEFIEKLCLENEINAFITMKDGFEKIAEENNVTLLRCNDTLTALGKISENYRDALDIKVVGITGTNGKTTTKEILAKILSYKFETTKSEKNYNNEIGVPFTLLNIKKNHEIAIIEMGMNHSGELNRLSKMVKPDISIITNIGEGHLQFLNTVENVAYAKAEIMHGMKSGSTLVLNRDTSCFDLVKEKAEKMNLKVITYGLDNKSDLFPEEYKLTKASVILKYKSVEITLEQYGIHNVYNLLGAIAVAEYYGMTPLEIRESLEGFKNIDGRSQVIEKNYFLIDDTYNSNPLSTRYALLSINKIFKDNKKIAVLSDMMELGISADKFHILIGEEVVENNFDLLLIIGEMAEFYKKGALQNGMSADKIKIFLEKDEIVSYLKNIIADDDVILVKGSRSMEMEKIISEL